jgi:large subunit ribosomal protein L30
MLQITLVRSTIGSKPKHRQTIEALGLRKLHSTVRHNDNPAIRGMIHKVRHLIKVEEV